MPENKALVAICNGRVQVEKTIAELQRLGFDMKQVSVVSKAYVSDEEIAGCYVADGHLRVCGGSAAFWEQLRSLLGEATAFPVSWMESVKRGSPTSWRSVSLCGHEIQWAKEHGAPGSN
jgi:hypothetical protein